MAGFMNKFCSTVNIAGNSLRNINLKSQQSTHILFRPSRNWYSTSPSGNESDKQSDPAQKVKVSKAMRAYLERAHQHDVFMKQQLTEFNIGKRHLANMMGEDPEMFEQKDIDEAIQYLFPSGLFDPKARPLMKPPEEVFPQRKEAEFDESGRPHHFLFYAGKPNFYKLLYDIVEHIEVLNEFEDRMIRRHLKPEEGKKIEMVGSEWLPKEEMEKILVESIIVKEYDSFVSAMERLIRHPYAYRVLDFVDLYRKPLMSQTKTYDIPKPLYDSDGRSFVTTKECLRKAARGEVTIRSPGTGLISINGRGIDYFETDQPREQLLFPLIFTEMLGKVDVEATVEGGGFSGQAGAVRWGIAWGLRSYVDTETVERMRLAGLLARDYRRRERKKPGQAKARKKFTWKKR